MAEKKLDSVYKSVKKNSEEAQQESGDIFEAGANLISLSNIVHGDLRRLTFKHTQKECGDGEDASLERYVLELKESFSALKELVNEYDMMDRAARVYQNTLQFLDINLPEEYKDQFGEFLADKK